jgi:hypothetical protein
MQTVLDYQRRDRRDLNHLMAQKIWILSLKQRAEVPAGIGVVFHKYNHPRDRQQLRPRFGMARLAAKFAAIPLRRTDSL